MDTISTIISPDETLDIFCEGRLKIIQKKKGYRFSIDSILLSEFIRVKENEKVIDLGTGCGILPLLLSRKAKTSSFIGVEIQKGLADCAKKNVMLNHLEDRITILNQDFRNLKNDYRPGTFDVVISNPPYRRYRTGRINPDMEKAIARHEIKGKLEDLISIASYLLKSKGRFYLIFPAIRTVDLLSNMRSNRLEPKSLQIIYPHINEDAKFVLAESIKESGIELKILPPIILHKSKKEQDSHVELKNFLTMIQE